SVQLEGCFDSGPQTRRTLAQHDTSSPKQILPLRPPQLPRAALATTIRITPDYTSRNARILTANQTGDRRQFVGHRFFGGVHFVTVGIAPAAIIVHHLHSPHADGNVAQTLAPRTPKAIGNDDGNVQSGTLL